MPKGQATAKPGGRSGLVIGLVMVVVVIGGAAAGLYFWSRASAASTALKFVDAQVAFMTAGKTDFATLKSVVTKEDLPELEKAESSMSQIPSGAMQAMFGSVKVTTAVKDVQLGLSEATVTVTAAIAPAQGAALSQEAKIALVREGLAWKVSAKKTGDLARPSSGGPPAGMPKM